MAKAKEPKEPDISRDPIITQWCGAPRYECRVCGRDSDSRSTIDDHIAGHFPVVYEEVTADGTATVDQDGIHGTVSDGGVGPDGNG